MNQEAFFIDGGKAHLYCVLFTPAEGKTGKAFLFCHPLFEEKKASHRMLVELARRLAAVGHAVLMLDFTACGDSGGAAGDFTPEVWLDDIRNGLAFLRERFQNSKTSLLGIRFGAALAIQSAADKNIENLILIDPVVNGKAYLEEILQQKYVREMMTLGEAVSDVDAMMEKLRKTGHLDVDGTIVSSAFYNSVESVDINANPIPPVKHILLIQQSPRKKLLPAYDTLQVKCQEANIPLDVSLLTVPPFWKAVEMADFDAVCDAILNGKI